MTESLGNVPEGALFASIQQMTSARGVDIRHQLNGNALRLEFADGQRILIKLDAQTRNIWLAARSGGTEFAHRDGVWRAHDQSEFFAKLGEIIEQTIASNPLNARAPIAQPQPILKHPAPVIHHKAKADHGLRNILIVLLASLLGFWAALRITQSHETAVAMAEMGIPGLSDTQRQCERNFPANGSISYFPESGPRTPDANDPLITVKNDHAHPLLLILTVPQTFIPAISVMIHARQSADLHAAAGQYDMMFSAGTVWCNPRVGFSDGHMLKFDKPLDVQSGKPLHLAMQSSGAAADDFRLLVKTTGTELNLPPPTFSGDGSMEVPRQANGHFYLPGTIENIPVTFMVDTGASVTSISSELARQIGIRNCKEVEFQTANGQAPGCIAHVARITLGNFVLDNITVAVMPNLETNLLGANVLRNFQVSQSESSMLIGRR